MATPGPVVGFFGTGKVPGGGTIDLYVSGAYPSSIFSKIVEPPTPYLIKIITKIKTIKEHN
jgi:hypothetical protein